MTPPVSVVMPVYNSEPYIAGAVESILAQTFGDYEFIILDDGSTDRSLAVIQEIARRDSRIRVISRPNTGQTRAMNELISEARGEFVVRMDSDDYSFPDRIEQQLAFLRAHPDVVAVGGEVIWMDRDGDLIRSFCVGHTHEQIDAAQLSGVASAVAQPASMIRRQVLLDIGGYRNELEPAEDFDVFLRLAEHGKLANLDRVVLRYRIHPDSSGGRQREAQNRMKHQALRDAHDRRGLVYRPVDLPLAEAGPKPGDSERLWAWWALQAGNVATARKLAWASLRQAPLLADSWVAMACAIRGR
jgi:glycosyltransferase involved in cell wall biosynthesis